MPEATQARQVHLWGQEGAFYGQEGAALRARQVRYMVKNATVMKSYLILITRA
jgi:hypothetical protein